MKFPGSDDKPQILIAGAGVAGASAAIRLALDGFRVCLLEKEKFPRQKLCGEFISPECFRHFHALGVFEEMLAAGGDRISETVFYAPSGKKVAVSSAWFAAENDFALGLSRAEMDLNLLNRAKNLGVTVFEETQINGLQIENEKITGIRAKTKSGEAHEIAADFFIDATVRAAILTKLCNKVSAKLQTQNFKLQTPLVGFKAHLRGARVERGVCEIYFFRGGYGGLSRVENEVSNHCFLIDARVVREFGGDAEKIVREVVFNNKRAAQTLQNAETMYDWLAVAVDGFGRKNLAPAANLIAVGDAGAFIDPFTGSGMLMALESAEIAAHAILQDLKNCGAIYQKLHEQKFNRRLRVCSLLRQAAFVPHLAGATISALSLSTRARQFLARRTRGEKLPANWFEKGS